MSRILASLFAVFMIGGAPSGAADEIGPAIARMLHAGTARDERLYTIQTLRAVYAARGHRRGLTPDGSCARVDSLLVEIDASAAEGLSPADYHGAALRSLAGTRRNGDDEAAFELLAADALLLLATHYASGRVNPETIDSEWFAARRGLDARAVLDGALSGRSVRASIRSLLPAQEGYRRLRAALERLRGVEESGGWPAVTVSEKLSLGATGPAVTDMAKRLAASGDLRGQTAETLDSLSTFDAELETAVRVFQDRHGLDVDGVVGPGTKRALNVSAAARVRTVRVNLERWRWLPPDLGARHVLVNIAGFSCALVEGRDTTLVRRAVVGRAYRRTPVFTGTMTHLVLNPSWDVPRRIAVIDKLPLIQRDPEYLAANRFEVIGADGRVIDAATVDWSGLSPGRFPYRLRQKPGPGNALGVVKFMFPNAFSVYLHDTSSPELFARASRTFSSGCIRIEDPLALAEALLAPALERAGIDSLVASGRETRVNLPAALPVHILYFTAWVERNGTLNLRDDVYGRDAPLGAALDEPAP